MSEIKKILKIVEEYKNENEKLKADCVKYRKVIANIIRERDAYISAIRKCDKKELSNLVNSFEDEIYVGKVAKNIDEFSLRDVVLEMLIKGYDMIPTEKGILMKVENRIEFEEIEDNIVQLMALGGGS